MALNDDLDGLFSDLAVSATAGSTTANGILDEPTQIEVGGQVLFVDYVFMCKSSDFGSEGENLVAGDAITIDSTAYEVRAAEKDSDGSITMLSVSKT